MTPDEEFPLPFWLDAGPHKRKAVRHMVWSLGRLELPNLMYGDDAPPRFGEKWVRERLQEAYR